MKTERPCSTTVKHDCDHCGAEILVVLEWYTWDGFKTWTQDTVETVDVNDRLCPECLTEKIKGFERAAQYTADVPPSDFDPTYCGERWNEED